MIPRDLDLTVSAITKTRSWQLGNRKKKETVSLNKYLNIMLLSSTYNKYITHIMRKCAFFQENDIISSGRKATGSGLSLELEGYCYWLKPIEPGLLTKPHCKLPMTFRSNKESN